MLSRRTAIAGAMLAAPALSIGRGAAETRRAGLAQLEARHGGRLGVAILDTATGAAIAHRGHERFPLCSTFKALAAAFALARVDRGQERLDRRIAYSRTDLVTYSPVTERHVGTGLTVGEICDAAVTLSDNTAGNLLFDSFGGPAGLTAYLRGIGDRVTRLDRRETALNAAEPGDPHDTTSPLAMAATMRRLLIGGALAEASAAQLAAWLVASKTGDKRLRAGVPKGWSVGDKTGSGNHNSANDVGIFWPSGKPPIIVAAYYTGSRASNDERDAVLAEVGRIAATYPRAH